LTELTRINNKNRQPLKSSADISNEIADKEKELKEHLNTLYLLDQEKLTISKEIIILQGKKKDIEIALSKASHIVKEINIDLSMMKKEFWATRNEGL